MGTFIPNSNDKKQQSANHSPFKVPAKMKFAPLFRRIRQPLFSGWLRKIIAKY
jgi:hypothetical protein